MDPRHQRQLARDPAQFFKTIPLETLAEIIPEIEPTRENLNRILNRLHQEGEHTRDILKALIERIKSHG